MTASAPPRNIPAGKNGVPPEWFEEAYTGQPLWEIGRPQAEVARLLAEGKIHGAVLDIGCGTGENSLLVARTGSKVVGMDVTRKAVELAAHKALARNIPNASFRVGSIVEGAPGETFDTALDLGVFHVFSDEHRPLYVRHVAASLHEGGSLYLVCFSELQPGGGPRRVREHELRACFEPAFRIDVIAPAVYETLDGPARAWRMEATKTRAASAGHGVTAKMQTS